MCQLRLHFNRLTVHVRTTSCMNVTARDKVIEVLSSLNWLNCRLPPMTVLPALSQARLDTLTARLQVVMHNIEVLKRWEALIDRQWSTDEELELPRGAQQTIAGVDAQLLADALNHPIDFRLEISGVVDDVKVGMSDPGGCRTVVQVTGQVNAF